MGPLRDGLLRHAQIRHVRIFGVALMTIFAGVFASQAMHAQSSLEDVQQNQNVQVQGAPPDANGGVQQAVEFYNQPGQSSDSSAQASTDKEKNCANGTPPGPPLNGDNGAPPPPPPEGNDGAPGKGGPPPCGQGPGGPGGESQSSTNAFSQNGQAQGGPGGLGQGGPGGPGGPGQNSATVDRKGVINAASGEEKASDNGAINSKEENTSAVYAHDGGSFTLTNPQITTSGNSSSQDQSSFKGLNAAVLATKGSHVTVNGGTILTSGSGANGGFAVDQNSEVDLTNVTITTTGGGAHGVMVAGGGTMKLINLTVNTAGQSAAAIATDRGGGVITSDGGNFTTTGFRSPSIYSTGDINVAHATMRSEGAEAAVIEGSNNITVIASSLIALKSRGVMLYQSFSGDALGRESHFNMRGGSLSAAVGPLFYVTNTHGIIKLADVKLAAASGTLLKAAAGQWGQKGSNGGKATLIASHQQLDGNLLVADATSSAEASLQNNSLLSGAIQGASLTLDASSKWSVTANSTVAALTVDDAVVKAQTFGNILGNGHTVTYDASLEKNHWLGGKTYQLTGGGELVPATQQ